MNGICLKGYSNIGKTMQDASHAMLLTNLHDRCCHCLIFLRYHIFFTKDNPCRVTGCNSFNSCQKVLLAQFSIGDTKNIRHTHNHSKPAAALHRTYPCTWFQSYGYHQFQTVHRPWLHHLPCRCTCFRGLRYR